MQNELLLKVLRGEQTDRAPIWLMRQAGRILPQYRALRASLSGFKELVSTPDLAAEVTIQPVDELGVDAAIIFSDILVIPEAMGIDYEMIKGKGPVFPAPLKSPAEVDALLAGANAAERLQYVFDAVATTRKLLNGRVPLIGFAGAPWTLFAYMVEGGGSKTFSKARRWLYREPQSAHRCLEKLTDTIIAYLKFKIQAGAQVVQVFDSWAGIPWPTHYQTFSLPYLQKIAEAITEVPVILFAKDAWFALDEIAAIPNTATGLDWHVDAAAFRQKIGPDKVLQGNLDPCCLYDRPDNIEAQTHEMLAQFNGNHIVNLGHGVYPDTPLEGVKAFVNAVQAYRY